MLRPHQVDQQKLLQFAERIDARSELPRLLRRLVLETGQGVTSVIFPAAEGVSTSGWDGVVRASGAGPFVASGLSLWELSVDKQVKKKAGHDYDKRTETPDGTAASEATYVAVSLRRWAGRANWAKSKNEDGRWREVRAYGVDDIETWLEAAPVTHAWLANRLGLEPYGVQAAESWWDGWSAATHPELPWQVPLAGRVTQADDLRARLAAEPNLITITGGGHDEILAFIVCCAREAPGKDAGTLARVALVDDVASWRVLIEHATPLVLVPMTEEVRKEARVKSSRHHIVVPLTYASSADLDLPPLDSGQATEALEQAGLEEQEAAKAGRLARRSLVALRRRLATKPELEAPPWASTPVPRRIRGILMAGGWNENFAEDQVILAELCGVAYEDLREELVGLTNLDDPFVLGLGEQWSVVSAYDAFLQLEGSLRHDDLERFAEAVEIVLLERDPVLDLSPSERYMAQPKGKVRSYSGELRSGLATTLAILGFRDGAVTLRGSNTGAGAAAGLTRKLLAAANQDPTGDLWYSIVPLLPLLAEAAPDQFLQAVRDGIQGDDPVVVKLFADAETDSA